MSTDRNTSTPTFAAASGAQTDPRPIPGPRIRQRERPAPTCEPPAVVKPPSEVGIPLETGTDYDVGYKKPPFESRFKPGRSGNPKGRPRGAKGLKTMVRETLTQKVAVRTAAGDKRMSRMEAVLHKTVELAMKGNQRALQQLYALYASAVPDAPAPALATMSNQELTATDLAILEELKASFAPTGEPDQ
ncbi:DUF5681 domain-containing protein [Novosphingobium sp. Gsoil 351]|uniref:DUF5681 domain-containing protein n=1 Tax=Novosphingobium sp. Gsoil 351 TaxID=2675225 RepID=UPI0012B4A6C3|nr:DUF5681 domain-containing protein [Novosphingobium sp. Gsoil 351]QGN56134.1 hypothetical protein GKE62_17860 [Novosphingobium sp. Gsoil 351]